MKVSFTNYYSQELNAYHDGVNLAYDLKKYSKRNKLQLVYEPNILNKIRDEEEAEKGNYGKSLKTKKGAKATKYDGRGFEDEDFLKHFPEPKLDKFASKQEKTSKPLVAEIKDEEVAKSTHEKEESDHSEVFLKRDALYKDLKTVNVSVEYSSTLEVIKDFLRNKINNKDQVDSLKQQNNYGSVSQQMADIFSKVRNQMAEGDDSGQPPSIHNIIQKMTIETLNESGNYSSMSNEDKMLLLKDIESLLGEASMGQNLGRPAKKSTSSSKISSNNHL